MFYSALVLGLVSSLHCVGMCAPLMLALPFGREKLVFRLVSYHIGRSTTYAVLGLLFGFVGKGLAVAGFQQSLSVLFGLIFIVLGLFSFIKNTKYNLHLTPSRWSRDKSVSKWIRGQFNRVLRWRGSEFWLGMLNGLLPCGMVYWAIAGSLLTFDPILGGFYMFLFGIGTMPLLLSVVLLKNFVSKNLISKFYRLIPAYQFALGVFLIWRAYRIDPSVLYLLSPVPMCH